MIETLLESRPSDDFLNQSLEVLRLAVGDARAENIVELCLQVANASGGFMNVGNVSAEERARIEAIADKLGPAAREAFAHPICFDVNDRQLLGWGAPRPQISRSAQSMKDASASDRSHSITPGSTATAESHSGRTTAATTTGSGTGADSNANRT